MLDPITALGVAGNVIQIIDFGLKATSKAREIYHSADGALNGNLALEAIATDLTAISKKLEDPLYPLQATIGCNELENLSRQVYYATRELLEALQGLKASGQRGRIKSASKALKAIWSEKRVEELKTRLEGFRDAMHLRILVTLRLEIDADSTRQSKRFDTLDNHAKDIFEAITTQQQQFNDAIQTESLRSDERHAQTITTIVTKQEEGDLDITRTVTETGELVVEAVAANGESIHSLISAESSRSDERHQSTTNIIVAKHDETHIEVKDILQSLDATARAEQESTRRELEQLKKAMVQIEQDMKQRDEELKQLLTQLSNTHNSKKRQALQERSNAVTIALCALATIYESLQKMVFGLQAHAKLILNSTTFKAWTTKTPRFIENGARRAMFDAVSNRPAYLFHDEECMSGRKGMGYLNAFSSNFSRNTQQGQRLWAVEFTGLETIDYQLMGRLDDSLHDSTLAMRIPDGVCHLLAFLDLTSEDQHILDRESFADNPAEELEFFKSIVILSSFLVVSLGVSGAVDALSQLCSLGRLFKSIFPGHSQRPDIILWTSIGEVAGFKKVAERMLNSRLQKWAALANHYTPDLSLTKDFICWLLLPNVSSSPHNPNNYFKYAPTIDRGSAPFYALIEYLNQFGFPVSPSIRVHSGSAHIWVDRIIPGTNHELGPREQEYAQYLQSGERKFPRMTMGEILQEVERELELLDSDSESLA